VTSGRIRVAAYTGAATPHERWRQGMGMLSEDRNGEGLARALSIADNMTMTRLEPLGSTWLTWPAFTVLPSRQDAAAARWIERLAIRCAGPRQAVAELSGGNQQRVAFGRLLHHDVDVLVLDEPTRGIDVSSKAQIYRLIDELVSRGGHMGPPLRPGDTGADPRTERAGAARTERAGADSRPERVGADPRVGPKAVLLVSSYFPELLGVCDRIAVMSRGRLGPARPAGEWTEHALLMEASGARNAS